MEAVFEPKQEAEFEVGVQETESQDVSMSIHPFELIAS